MVECGAVVGEGGCEGVGRVGGEGEVEEEVGGMGCEGLEWVGGFMLVLLVTQIATLRWI